jgi:hypothetical protein
LNHVRLCLGAPGRERVFYEAHARQDDFHFADAPNVLYGGAAGGGKSHALRMDAYIRCLTVPGYRALLLRRTYPELNNTHIERVFLEAGQLGAVYNKTEYKLRFSNGSVLEFGHVEDDAAVAKYLSTEYDAIYFDELVTFTLHQFKFIASRARTTKPGIVPIIRAGSNPGGVNSWWVRRYFIFKDIGPTEDPTYRPENYAFIPATLDDNPHIDPTYEARLMALPSEALRRAYRYGDWEVFEGQFFGEWRKQTDEGEPWHVVNELPTIDGKPLTEVPWIDVFRSIDWGYRDPGICGWYACLPDGRLLKFQEYVFQETMATEVAKEIRRRSAGMRVRYTVADPAMFMREGQLGESLADTFQRQRVPLLKADNERINGWQQLHRWLQETTVAGNRKVPLLQVYGPGCPYTVRTIPSLVVDDHKLEDVKTKGTEDHAGDETRYAVMSRPAPSHKPRLIGYPIGTLGHDIQKLLNSLNKPDRLGSESVRR